LEFPRHCCCFLLPALLLIVVFFVVAYWHHGHHQSDEPGLPFPLGLCGTGDFFALWQDTLIPRVLLNTGVYVFTTLLLFHLGLGWCWRSLPPFTGTPSSPLPDDLAAPALTPSVVYILLWRLRLDPTNYGLLNRLRAALGVAAH